MHLCVRGIDLAHFYDFFIGFWNCSNSVWSFFFFILLFLVNYLSIGTYLEYCNLTLNTNKKSRHQTYIGKHLVFHFCSYRPITCLYYILSFLFSCSPKDDVRFVLPPITCLLHWVSCFHARLKTMFGSSFLQFDL